MKTIQDTQVETELIRDNNLESINTGIILKSGNLKKESNPTALSVKTRFQSLITSLNLRGLFSRGNGKGNGTGKNSINDLEAHLKQLEEQILGKKIEKKQDIIRMLHSHHDKPVKEINVTYPVNPPSEFARITYDQAAEELLYMPVEPVLEDAEKKVLQRVRGLFELEISGGESDPAAYLEHKARKLIDFYGIKVSPAVLDKILFYLKREFIGYSEIDLLMKDPYIEDISCNGPGRPIYVYHRVFESMRTSLKFESEYRLNSFVLKMAQISGRHISVLDPITDAALPDGSRINLTYSNEVTKKGSSFTIRKFKSEPISPIDILKYGTLSPKQLAYLWLVVEYGRSILVSGGTATGKTTLLNSICLFINPASKVVSIEDTSEINIPHENWIQSITRSGFGREGLGEGTSKRGDVGLYDLLTAALRQRPDYIIVGEVRGSEAFTLFQAISVGHAAMGTIHAGSIEELVNRIESPPMNVPRNLLAGVDLAIFTGRILRGDSHVRRVVDMVEMLEIDKNSGNLITNNAFHWDPYNDEFLYNGRSFLLENIAQENGIELEYLKTEMANREKFIEWMSQKEVVHFKEVARNLRAYYQRHEEFV